MLRAQDRWLGRPVALKELLHRSPEATARFFREARLTARLQHPGIVPVYELTFRSDGAPFYAMKLIAGERFDKRIERATSLDERLALLPNVIAVTEAIAYAHDQGIIHRDLKPSNVIVGEFGETIVIDWGLAKDLTEVRGPEGGAATDEGGARDAEGSAATDRGVLDDTLLAIGTAGSSERTRAGRAMGTLAYMPPEQYRGEAVDERADVFALGAFLVHTITGAAPYARETSSEALARIAEARIDLVEDLAPGVPLDLAAIVRKAMARERGDRYPSAKALAADLRRFQTGQLVSAHVYSRATLAQRWLARNRRTAITAAAFLLALNVLGALSIRRIVAERDRAERERTRAQAEGTRAEERAQELTFVEARASLDRDPTASLAWLKTARLDATSYARAATIALDARERGVARHVWRVPGSVREARFTPDGTRVVAGGTLEGLIVWDAASGEIVQRVPQRERIKEFQITPDGHYVVAATDPGDLFLVDLRSGATRTLPRPHRSMNFALSHDGRTIAAGDTDGTVHEWDLETGAEHVLARLPRNVRDLAFGPDDAWLAAVANDAIVRTIDRKTGHERRLPGEVPDGRFDVYVHVSPDGRRLVSRGAGPVLRLWELASGASHVLLDGQGEIHGGAFTGPDTFVSGNDDGAVRVWNLARGTMRSLAGHSAYVNHVDVSPDGAYVLTCSDDTTVRLWDLRTMTARVLRGHRATVLACTFSADGRSIVTGGTDGTLRVWDTQPSPEIVLGGHQADVYALAWSPDGALVASGDESGLVRVWDPDRGTGFPLDGHDEAISNVAFLDRGHLASASKDGPVRVWDLASHQGALLGGDAEIVTMAATRDGRALVTGDARGTVRVWDLAEGHARALVGHEGAVGSVVLSPDESQIASGGDDGTVRTWDFATGAPRLVLRGHGGRVTGVTFAKGDAVLASSSWDGTVRTWETRSGAPLEILRGSGDRFGGVTSSVDGELLAAPNHDRTASVWNLATGGSFKLVGHDDSVRETVFSRDDRFLMTPGDDGATRLWGARTGRLLTERRSASNVMIARFSPDGLRVATGGWDDAVRVWPLDEAAFIPGEPAKLKPWLEKETSAIVGDEGRVMSAQGDARR